MPSFRKIRRVLHVFFVEPPAVEEKKETGRLGKQQQGRSRDQIANKSFNIQRNNFTFSKIRLNATTQ